MNFRKLAVLAVLFVAVSGTSFAQGTPSAAVSRELIAAEAQMFAKITQQDPEFMKNLVAEDYYSINADGSTADKAQLMAQNGSAQQKMMAAATYEHFDQRVRAYGDVGIITGRTRASMNGTYLVEFLHTAVFVKRDGKWLFTLWQGTISKDSPPPQKTPSGI